MVLRAAPASVVLAAALHLAALAAPVFAAPPPVRPGAPISSHAMVHTCCTPLAMKERLFAESKEMGARLIRVDVELSGIFQAGRPPDWRQLDQVKELSQRYQLPVLGILLGTPPWLSSCPDDHADAARCAPRDAAEFGRLAGEVAARARDTIGHWEILNEPDAAWAFEGSSEDYARMLRAAHDGIEARAPEAKVVLGGLETPQDPSWLERFLATPGADAVHAFDVASLHLRAPADLVPARFAAWRDLLAERGFTGPVWVTEHGYPAEPGFQYDGAYRGGEPAQAAYLTQSVLALAEAGAAEVFVTLRDNLDGPFASEGAIALDQGPGYDARRKPAFHAVRRLVDRWDHLMAARADQRRHEAAAGQERNAAAFARLAARTLRVATRNARSALARVRARHRRARRAHARRRLARQVVRRTAVVRRHRDQVAWADLVAGYHDLQAAFHASRALDLARQVAGP